jgi:beta-lactamase superfamily II metal-dependent hydrolase
MVHLLSPNFESLSKLERYWCKELYKLGYRDVITKNEIFDDAFEFLLRNEKKKLDARVEKISNSSLSVPELLKTEFVEDLSITNRSSIAFILETHNSKMLFLGDSAVSLVEPSLKKYNSNQAQILHFDFIMVSHHGSRNNTNSDLLAAIDATNFCISTDGQKHEHPDLETLALIVSRNTPTKRKLFFNYRTDSSNAFNTKEIMEQYKYDVLYPKDEILTIQVD